jgi:extracellular elastinolytic metalloproteinase
MRISRHRSAWLLRTTLLLVPAVVGCASDPPISFTPPSDDDGRVVLGASSLDARNYDARDRHNSQVRFADGMVTPRFTGRFAAQDIAASFDEATGATRTLMAHVGFLTGPNPGSALTVAQNFARGHLDMLGLSAADLADMEVTDLVYSEIVGVTHVYYRQRHLGLPVYNAQFHVNVDRDGRILNVNNTFVPNIAKLAKSVSPSIGAEHAVLSAAANLSVDLAEAPSVASSIASGVERKTVVDAPGLSKEAVEAQLMWMPVNAKHLALVWRFQIETLDGNHYFDYTVDAETGKVWSRADWVASDGYRVYPEPVESPNHTSPLPPSDGRVLVTNPANAAASPQGWHSTGSTTYNINRGNNVHSYDDRDANGLPPASEPACSGATPNLVCNFPIDLTLAPSGYTPAAVTNLFYWNNLIHDVTYGYGFNEVGGNFQVNNFGNGGLGNDDVRAEAQDGGGTNNANFLTPADGSRPRMQMYEWTQTTPRRDGDLDSGIIMHEYGHGISNRLVGGPSNVSCLSNAQQGGEGWSDWFGLWFTARATDVGTTGRGIGTYALGQPTTGPGIRTQRYSTDPTINTWTYASISGMAIPHGVGSVWAQAIWEVYWALVDKYGYSSNLHNAAGTAGNQRAMLYVIQGLKNTTCSPTFVNARDGIIAAATAAHGGEDVCLLWQTFAAFGLGTNAVSGGSGSTSPTNGFQVPASCQCSPQPVANAGPDHAICTGQSVTLGTPAQPGTTYSWSPGGATTAQITVAPTATTTYTVTATTTCGSASDAAVVTVSAGNSNGLDTNFESDTTGWTATGLWHLVNNSTCASPAPGYSSPTRAFYYGQDSTCTYNTGATNSGTLTSPPVSGIASTSNLSFNYFRRVESYNGAYDRTFVDVIRSNGAVTTVWSRDSRDASSTAWASSGNISLSAFAGDTIRLRFTFNTVDSLANAFTGWLIDDVKVTAPSSCPTAAQPLYDPFENVPLPVTAFALPESR